MKKKSTREKKKTIEERKKKIGNILKYFKKYILR
jgi:hypothetical protein